jgi:hypothetical protein
MSKTLLSKIISGIDQTHISSLGGNLVLVCEENPDYRG